MRIFGKGSSKSFFASAEADAALKPRKKGQIKIRAEEPPPDAESREISVKDVLRGAKRRHRR